MMACLLLKRMPYSYCRLQMMTTTTKKKKTAVTAMMISDSSGNSSTLLGPIHLKSIPPCTKISAKSIHRVGIISFHAGRLLPTLMQGSENQNGESETKSKLQPTKPFMFQPQQGLPPYEWKIPTETFENPAVGDLDFEDLLMYNVFIDKSAALFDFLKSWFLAKKGDFQSKTLHLVYPRRFAKTTLLQLIEAVYSPVPQLGSFTIAQVKNKIASLEKGQDLLKFGMHPVVWIDMQSILSVEQLNRSIGISLKQAGLEDYVVNEALFPSEQLRQGVTMLNEKFQADFNVATKTIVLIDEHDKPFRQRNIEDDSNLLEALVQLYSLGKEKKTGISLFILCGLTRMVGTGLSKLNNLVDVSRLSKFHGLCGVSAKEIVHSCQEALDPYANDLYEGKNLDAVLHNTFTPKWNGFRFGIDKTASPLSALFSPLDVWEIVKSLVEKETEPSSKWEDSMDSEFEFANFSKRFTSTPDAFIELAQNLEGGWWKAAVLKKNMKREHYLELSEDKHVQKVLFELGLLSVKRIGDHKEVLLGSPNWMVTENAMKMLIEKTHHGATTGKLATSYLSKKGFAIIVNQAKMVATNVFRGTGQNVIREYPFQDFLFMQLFYRFPTRENVTVDYKLYKESPVGKAQGNGRLDIGIALLYPKSKAFEKKAFIIEMKLDKIISSDSATITAAHQKNLQKATEQVNSYQWEGERVDSVQRVVVSGVWHPSTTMDKSYELSASYEFLVLQELLP